MRYVGEGRKLLIIQKANDFNTYTYMDAMEGHAGMQQKVHFFFGD